MPHTTQVQTYFLFQFLNLIKVVRAEKFQQIFFKYLSRPLSFESHIMTISCCIKLVPKQVCYAQKCSSAQESSCRWLVHCTFGDTYDMHQMQKLLKGLVIPFVSCSILISSKDSSQQREILALSLRSVCAYYTLAYYIAVYCPTTGSVSHNNI